MQFPTIERVRVRGGGASHEGPRAAQNVNAFAFIEDDGAALAIVAGGIGTATSGRNAADLTIATASEIFRGLRSSVLDDLAEVWWFGEHGDGKSGPRARPYTSLPIADRVGLRDRVRVVLAERVPESMGDVAVLEAEARSVLAIPERALERANVSIYRRSEQNRPGWRGSGASAVCAVFASKHASIAHVGDCRAYHVRGGTIETLTTEHTLQNEMARGQLAGVAGDVANVPANVIVRALGLRDTIEIDTRAIPIEAGDVFVLASDGVWRALSPDELRDLVSKHGGVAARALLERARAARPEHRDGNPTAVVVEVL
jgi:serine/threonine protein phosphatase PrpC